MLKQNLNYWEISLKNPEPIIDEYYTFNKLIVQNQNLIQKVERLRELITTYCVLLEIDRQALGKVLDEIYMIALHKNIQYTEFIAFWKTLDLSYSSFRQLPERDRKLMLHKILEEYCEKRKKLYDELGYSNIVVQALYDSGVSRKKGKAGIEKITNLILQKLKGSQIFRTIDELKDQILGYFLPDQNKVLFDKFIANYNIEYRFSQTYQGKLPDVVLKAKDHFFIIEAKHINETGGAQDKQIAELISFINQREPFQNIHYVAFLDGLYFNYFINPPQGSKVYQQKEDIENCLKRNQNNFFVNTAGFVNLLQDLGEGRL
ncbi:MAG: hypothetical protein LM570_02670 [Thermocrinis sp.]|nr:hypothetical protein [Thermocrinis sp.]